MAETRTLEPIVRPVVPALEAILGEPIRVLDETHRFLLDSGFRDLDR